MRKQLKQALMTVRMPTSHVTQWPKARHREPMLCISCGCQSGAAWRIGGGEAHTHTHTTALVTHKQRKRARPQKEYMKPNSFSKYLLHRLVRSSKAHSKKAKKLGANKQREREASMGAEW